MRCMREGAPIGGVRGFCGHPPANRPPAVGDRPIAHRLGCEERDPHAQARRHQEDAHHRLRTHHHRPGVRVRLLRHPGLQGPAQLGYEVVLVNSNPATIMTDPEHGGRTYIEPLNAQRLEQIIAKERPDALLPNLGGQTGLNLRRRPGQAGRAGQVRRRRSSACRSTPSSAARTASCSRSHEATRHRDGRIQVAYSVEEASPSRTSWATRACCARPTPWAARAAASSTTRRAAPRCRARPGSLAAGRGAGRGVRAGLGGARAGGRARRRRQR